MLVAMLLARSDEVAEMRRRDMLKAALGFTWIAVPNATVAQTRGRKRIGYLSGGSHGLRENNIDILEKHLGALGWRAGETREFEERWADGDFSRLPRLASELVMLRPDVIVATGSTETTSLHIATNEHRTSRLVLRPSGPSNSISGCRLFIPIPTGLLLETRPNGVWSLVLGADHEATRSQLLLAGTTFASLTVVRAQQPGRLCQIGIVMLYPEKDRQGQLRSIAFRQQLEKIGWTVDGNLQINFKWGTGDADWVRSATEDVLSGKPDVLLGDAAAKAAQRATRTVPIIFIGSGRRSHSKPRPSAT